MWSVYLFKASLIFAFLSALVLASTRYYVSTKNDVLQDNNAMQKELKKEIELLQHEEYELESFTRINKEASEMGFVESENIIWLYISDN